MIAVQSGGTTSWREMEDAIEIDLRKRKTLELRNKLAPARYN